MSVVMKFIFSSTFFTNLFCLSVCPSPAFNSVTKSSKFKVQKGGTAPPQFSAHVLGPNGWMDQDATWYGCRPQPRRVCVRWGPSFPPPKKKKGHSPQFSAHVYCGGQTAGWMKTPLGTEVDNAAGDIAN